LNKLIVKTFLKHNPPVNYFKLLDNALLIWNDEIKEKTDYNFDYAFTYDSINVLKDDKDYIYLNFGEDRPQTLKFKKKSKNKM